MTGYCELGKGEGSMYSWAEERGRRDPTTLWPSASCICHIAPSHAYFISGSDICPALQQKLDALQVTRPRRQVQSRATNLHVSQHRIPMLQLGSKTL